MTTPAVAPSATPIAPAVSAPSAVPAATPSTNLNSLEHFAALAKADLVKNASAPAPAATEPPAVVPPVAPDPNAPPATPPAVAPDPNAPAAPAAPEPAAPVQTNGLEEPDEAEPTPEEQATWSEGEKRIYGALQKERAARKEAKAKLKQQSEENTALKDRLEKIEAKLNPDGDQPRPSAAEPAAAPGALGDCHTFEAVDARATQAATTEVLALRLQRALAEDGAAAVVEELKAKGVTHIGNIPLAEAGDKLLSNFLTTVQEGAAVTRIQADSRKRFIAAQATAWGEAVKLVPELADPKSDRAKRFVQIVNATPNVRQLGAHWPFLVAQNLLGAETVAAKAAASARPAPPAIQPTPTPTAAPTRQVPSAPRATPQAPPKKSDYEEAAATLATGKATLADVTRMARAGLTTG